MSLSVSPSSELALGASFQTERVLRSRVINISCDGAVGPISSRALAPPFRRRAVPCMILSPPQTSITLQDGSMLMLSNPTSTSTSTPLPQHQGLLAIDSESVVVAASGRGSDDVAGSNKLRRSSGLSKPMGKRRSVPRLEHEDDDTDSYQMATTLVPVRAAARAASSAVAAAAKAEDDSDTDATAVDQAGDQEDTDDDIPIAEMISLRRRAPAKSLKKPLAPVSLNNNDAIVSLNRRRPVFASKAPPRQHATVSSISSSGIDSVSELAAPEIINVAAMLAQDAPVDFLALLARNQITVDVQVFDNNTGAVISHMLTLDGSITLDSFIDMALEASGLKRKVARFDERHQWIVQQMADTPSGTFVRFTYVGLELFSRTLKQCALDDGTRPKFRIMFMCVNVDPLIDVSLCGAAEIGGTFSSSSSSASVKPDSGSSSSLAPSAAVDSGLITINVVRIGRGLADDLSERLPFSLDAESQNVFCRVLRANPGSTVLSLMKDAIGNSLEKAFSVCGFPDIDMVFLDSNNRALAMSTRTDGTTPTLEVCGVKDGDFLTLAVRLTTCKCDTQVVYIHAPKAANLEPSTLLYLPVVYNSLVHTLVDIKRAMLVGTFVTSQLMTTDKFALMIESSVVHNFSVYDGRSFELYATHTNANKRAGKELYHVPSKLCTIPLARLGISVGTILLAWIRFLPDGYDGKII